MICFFVQIMTTFETSKREEISIKKKTNEYFPLVLQSSVQVMDRKLFNVYYILKTLDTNSLI